MTAGGPPPAHLVAPGSDGHGVTVLARQLARQVGAVELRDFAAAAAAPAVHLHLTDRLFGESPGATARAVVALAARTELTVTLHDVPQPGDGPAFAERRACYTAVLAAGTRWVANSETERATVERWCAPVRAGHVIPLPVVPLRPAAAARASGDRRRSVGLFGWVYPGKGHDDVMRSVALLGGSRAERPLVVAIGAVPDHGDAYVRRLDDLGRRLGVDLTITGWIDDDAVAAHLAEVDVPVAAHVNVSASGSINSWLAAGRRPLVRDSAYAREMARLRPGTLELYPASTAPAPLAEHLAARLDRPRTGRVPEPSLRPHLEDVALYYQRWWAAA